MDSERAFSAVFWTWWVIMLSMRAWFQLRIWRAGERLGADRAARKREGVWAHVVAYLVVLLLAAVVVRLCFQGGDFRSFTFAAPDWLRWAGVGLGVTSMGLFAWTHVVLGRFWSPYLQLRPSHRLLTVGPYSRIRHPMYSAIVGWVISLGLVAASWIPLAFAALIALNFNLRIRGEEKMMLQQFGDEYREYMKRTGRLLPAL
jgi:protein-S-isoprenylcysteine O-methyltransferase Ste14